MPTDIYFASENVCVKVDEEPSQVAEAFTSARGLPLRLTAPGGRRDVYVNPSMVAFWLVSESGREFAGLPGESLQPMSGQEIVTYDVWGRPVRRKPRR
jgi:hypothetical protein